MRKYIKTSFKRQLLLCFILVAILPLIICSFLMINLFKMKIENDHQKEIATHVDGIEDALIDFFDEVDGISDELHQNELVIQTLYEKKLENRNKTYQALYDYTSELRSLAQFELYSIGGICKYSTSSDSLNTKLPTYWGILKAASEQPDSLVIYAENRYMSKHGDILLRAARAIKDNEDNDIGYIVISMKADDFDNLLDNTYNVQDSIAVVNSQWKTIYSTEPAKDVPIVPMIREQLMTGGDLSEINKESKFYISSVGTTGLYIVLQRAEVFTADISKSIYNVSGIMTILSLALCIAVSLSLSNNLSKPIHTITEAMHEMEEGCLDIQVKTDREDEFGKLAENFNIMAGKLSDYLESQVKQQQELNDSNIALMQAQLNPHFIYNTLDTIKWVAKANNIPEITTLVASLAKILRTSISSSKFIELKEELQLCQCYVNIQKVRFDGKFNYTASLPCDLEKCIVPKLVIQPLVENAILHGLADREDGNIDIKVWLENDRLLISVSDDGCGMDEEIMEKLNSGDRSKLAEHIGFYNVDTIIRLRYGNTYGTSIEAIEAGGTKVKVVLPIIKEVSSRDA